MTSVPYITCVTQDAVHSRVRSGMPSNHEERIKEREGKEEKKIKRN